MPRRPLAPVFHIDDIASYCWCESEVVHIPRSMVRAGVTRSCGRRGCEEPA